MQTFLVAANDLDIQRLRKQIVECKQIVLALETGKGWIHHPATKMWTGYTSALVVYALDCIAEYKERGFESSLQEWFIDRYDGSSLEPWWWDERHIVETHRSNLIRKLPEHYKPLYPDARENLPYLWPAQDGSIRLSIAEASRNPVIPDGWMYTSKTREVVFDD